ncbi:MAG TPA: histidine kinase dimerization/phosphoacceptor domain-containing protein [Frankiaceae bacterium]|nr:histidine kinase dimerization/phosphoacceptor domain-containing protein [Frankiaceae bacterium]
MLLAVTAALAAEGEKIDAYLGNWLLVAATFALGDSVRSRRAHVLTLEMRALRAERDREDMARRAVVEERARIAREMHDVVAHSISVMVVQAAAARCTRDRDGAEAAMAQIETTGR